MRHIGSDAREGFLLTGPTNLRSNHTGSDLPKGLGKNEVIGSSPIQGSIASLISDNNLSAYNSRLFLGIFRLYYSHDYVRGFREG